MQICNEGDVMSVDATRWAWSAPVKSSTQRLVLLSLADRAGEYHTCFLKQINLSVYFYFS